MSSIKLSVVVPTHNRQELLFGALVSFANQSCPRSIYEIILVDNNSSDQTKEVFRRFREEFPEHNARYIFEGRQGLHHARNRGILAARGDIVVFGDDDIEASSSWLEEMADSFGNDPTVGIVGGPVYAVFEREPPSWVFDYGTRQTHLVFACLDYGDKGRFLEQDELFGCNFAIRRRIALEVKGSGPDTYPRDMIHYSGSGEFGMAFRVRRKGHRVCYNPGASVRHFVPASRCTPAYFEDRYRRWAVEDVYGAYNKGSSLPSLFLFLCRQSVGVLRRMGKGCLSTKTGNRVYYGRIYSSYLFFMWNHFSKLLTNTQLRIHSKRTDHIGDLIVAEWSETR